MTASKTQPSHIPAEFKLRRRLTGGDAHGFTDDPEQTVLIYTQGWEPHEWAFALTVFEAHSRRPLVATENREGTPVSLATPGATATYHDGMWAMDGARADAMNDVMAGLYWSHGLHSVTVRRGSRAYAVRAPQSVSLGELTRIAGSLLAN